MTTKYLIWIQSGVTSIALITEKDHNKVVLKNPFVIVNMQYGVRENGELTNPGDPDSVKTRFVADMAPYVFYEHVNGSPDFIIEDISSICYSIIDDEASPIIQQYLDINKKLA